jgi:hypothetical protein
MGDTAILFFNCRERSVSGSNNLAMKGISFVRQSSDHYLILRTFEWLALFLLVMLNKTHWYEIHE